MCPTQLPHRTPQNCEPFFIVLIRVSSPSIFDCCLWLGGDGSRVSIERVPPYCFVWTILSDWYSLYCSSLSSLLPIHCISMPIPHGHRRHLHRRREDWLRRTAANKHTLDPLVTVGHLLLSLYFFAADRYTPLHSNTSRAAARSTATRTEEAKTVVGMVDVSAAAVHSVVVRQCHIWYWGVLHVALRCLLLLSRHYLLT